MPVSVPLPVLYNCFCACIYSCPCISIRLCLCRYAKKMDGSKAFTICGDPLYFAPEIVSQQGYDYSVDLWAFGVLLYELFEGASPFGTEETEETAVFKAITGLLRGGVKYSKTPPEVSEVVSALLDPEAANRIGYKDSAELRSAKCFSKVSEG